MTELIDKMIYGSNISILFVLPWFCLQILNPKSNHQSHISIYQMSQDPNDSNNNNNNNNNKNNNKNSRKDGGVCEI